MGLLDSPPSGLTRLLLRAPVVLYRLGLGRVLGHRFAYLVHLGRTSGRRREVVLEVVARDRGRPAVVVVAAWGERADWYRNIHAAPAVELRTGRWRWPAPGQRVLTTAETVDVLLSYRARHARAWKHLAPVLGLPADPAAPTAREALARIRAVAFTPR